MLNIRPNPNQQFEVSIKIVEISYFTKLFYSLSFYYNKVIIYCQSEAKPNLIWASLTPKVNSHRTAPHRTALTLKSQLL